MLSFLRYPLVHKEVIIVVLKIIAEFLAWITSFFVGPKPQKQGDPDVDIVKMIGDLVATIAALKSQLEMLEKQSVDAKLELDKVAKESYDKGFADGVASVPPPPISDKIYSQSEVDQIMKEACGPLEEKVAGLEKELDLVKANIQHQIDQAVNSMKAELLEKYEAMLVVEKQAETGFADLLK